MDLFDRPPVFIVGAQRSGTTWIQRMLADHPLIVSGQESHLFSGYLAPMWERWELESRLQQEGGRTIGLSCYLTEDELLDEMRRLTRRVFQRLHQNKPSAIQLVEKTPDHGLHLPLIHRLFPNAIVIHVVRDGRDVVASLLHAHRQEWGHAWTPSTGVHAAERWATWVTAIQKELPLFERSLTVKYEDFVESGPDQLCQIFDYLNLSLPFEEVESIHDRWRFDEASTQTRDSLQLAGEQAGTNSREPKGFYRQGKIGKWKDELTLTDQLMVAEHAGDVLERLGYERESISDTAETSPHFISTVPYDDLLWRFPKRLDVINSTNAQMLPRERWYLYATIFALAPKRCLEIGVSEGGSTRIIHAALSDLKQGRLIALDPQLQLSFDPNSISDRVTFLDAFSPAGLSQAVELAGGLFDFVLLDGDHSQQGVRDDLLGLSDVTASGAIILAHDAYYPPVAEGLNQAIKEGAPFVDAGMVSTTLHRGRQGNEDVSFAGFRMLVRTDQRRKSGPWQKLTRFLKRISS